MKTIKLISIALTNFKGLKSTTINFEDNTQIYGANGTGKTTIADAFTWLLFGKDTTDRKDFEIKTLDHNGKVIPQIDHEVSATLLIDNDPLTLRRVLKENWVKKRGNEEREFSGNVTELYWNDVPMSVTEFTKKVSEILPEQVFKMITSPVYFNSIKWQDRRNLLIDIFGEVSNEEVAKGNTAFEKLLEKLTQGKTLEDYKAQISASIKKAKEDLKAIPARIDEVFRGKPEAQDFRVLEIEIEGYSKKLEKVDSELADANKAYNSKLDAQRSDKLKANNIKSDIEIIEQNAKKEAQARLKPDTSVLDTLVKEKNAKNQELESFENALKTLETKKDGITNQSKSIEKQIADKRQQWHDENDKVLEFKEDDCNCPTCKQALPSGDIENKKAEAMQNFKTSKLQKLKQIENEGQNLATQKSNLEAEFKTIVDRIETGNTAFKNCKEELKSIIDKIEIENNNTSKSGLESKTEEEIFKSLLDANQKYQELLIELEAIESSIVEVPAVDNSELVEKRKALVSEIDLIKAKLQSKSQIEIADKRMLELQTEEKNLSQQIANVEKEQFVIENFIKAKVDALENVVNSKFNYVKFKMFEEQINGGLRETCEAMVNGVPYSDVNTASKINAGLDIINVLSEFYGINAPIFVDNAESVHTLIDTESQMIKLIVSEQHKVLTATEIVQHELFAS
ncbi:MAG: AAA family ATPase [Flavobacterium sp.]|uniref:AAA family ATPase n=1 Tax=Flavobacterium sp. TaxID=239 RepID=UPI002B49C602|nr:AAA family ATPase [Flavobacterium sp.]WRH74190.1 MAG: AAA family ATPase [Flavobacterium sp.]